jgi:small subunit ribosomal protein S6
MMVMVFFQGVTREEIKAMPFYETVFMARQDLTEAQVTELTTMFSKIITDHGGKIVKTENWGLRTLAYPIKKGRKAHYVLLETDAPGPAVIELERNLRLNEDVLRSLTVRLDELSKGPSAIIDRSNRYDTAEKEAA